MCFVQSINCGVADRLIESIQPSCRRARYSLPLDPNIPASLAPSMRCFDIVALADLARTREL